MIEHYRECTELDDETIKKVLLPPQDVYLSAEEALNYKICDHVAQLKR
jgi:ATP-dependent protease ClpP protease subunit